MYRSSYKNALRLAVTETNIAYHTADYERWQQMDFVVGIKVKLSGNHTTMDNKGKPRELHDICDELEGMYPKDFKFVGWHPFCRCSAVPVFKSADEMAKDTERIMAGEDPLPPEESENAVRELPEGFQQWTKNNADKIEGSYARGTQPYFLKDNFGSADEVGAGGRWKPRETKIDTRGIADIISGLTAPRDHNVFVAVDPFSPVIAEQLSKLRDKAKKLKMFKNLVEDSRFTVNNIAENGCRTTVHPGHKVKNGSWPDTLKMAHALNDSGRDVVFLPEDNNISNADAVTIIKGIPRVVDFKYCATTKYNTLQQHLAEGFTQAGAIVLKLENMDAGQFRETIEYMKRKKLPLGDMVLINSRNQVREILLDEFNSDKYKKKIRGYLR